MAAPVAYTGARNETARENRNRAENRKETHKKTEHSKDKPRVRGRRQRRSLKIIQVITRGALPPQDPPLWASGPHTVDGRNFAS